MHTRVIIPVYTSLNGQSHAIDGRGARLDASRLTHAQRPALPPCLRCQRCRQCRRDTTRGRRYRPSRPLAAAQPQWPIDEASTTMPAADGTASVRGLRGMSLRSLHLRASAEKAASEPCAAQTLLHAGSLGLSMEHRRSVGRAKRRRSPAPSELEVDPRWPSSRWWQQTRSRAR